MCTGWWRIEAPLLLTFMGGGMIPFAPFALLGRFGKGGRIELLSGSRGINGGGGIYAGYFDIISWRKMW
jgi:hypothetical protein